MKINQLDTMMIGEKNILVAREILKEYKISIVAEDIGGEYGRKIQFDLLKGKVLMKYAHKNSLDKRG